MKKLFTILSLILLSTSGKPALADPMDPVDPFIPHCANLSAYFEVNLNYEVAFTNQMQAISSMKLNTETLVRLASRPIALVSVTVDENFAKGSNLNAFDVAKLGLMFNPKEISRVTVRLCPNQ